MKVREVLRRLEAQGWHVVRQTGSHRILKNHERLGIVVVAGGMNKDLATGTLRSIWRQARMEDER